MLGQIRISHHLLKDPLAIGMNLNDIRVIFSMTFIRPHYERDGFIFASQIEYRTATIIVYHTQNKAVVPGITTLDFMRRVRIIVFTLHRLVSLGKIYRGLCRKVDICQ